VRRLIRRRQTFPRAGVTKVLWAGSGGRTSMAMRLDLDVGEDTLPPAGIVPEARRRERREQRSTP
jgi:hypothetical protein